MQNKKSSDQKINYKCPPKLAVLIKLVNLLPGEYFNRILDGENPIYFHMESENKLNVFNKLITENSEIKSFLCEESLVSFFQGRTEYERFEELILTRNILFSVAGAFNYLESTRQFEDSTREYLFWKYSKEQMLNDFSTGWVLILTEEGIIKPQFSEIINIFVEEDINYLNIRICLNCGKIYWAKRGKSRTCSKKCSNALINRKYRDENKNQINKNRRYNYKVKNKKKESK